MKMKLFIRLMNVKLILGCLLFFNVFVLKAQSAASFDSTAFCKKWKLSQFHEKGGKILNCPAEFKENYFKFNRNGSFEALEVKNRTLKGSWKFSQADSILILTEHSGDSKFEYLNAKVLTMRSNQLILQLTKESDNRLTIYLKPE